MHLKSSDFDIINCFCHVSLLHLYVLREKFVEIPQVQHCSISWTHELLYLPLETSREMELNMNLIPHSTHVSWSINSTTRHDVCACSRVRSSVYKANCQVRSFKPFVQVHFPLITETKCHSSLAYRYLK